MKPGSSAVLILAALGVGAAHAQQRPANPSASAPAPSTGWPARFIADSVHSSISFRVRHLGIATVAGRFHSFTVEFEYDSVNFERSSVTARIRTASIDTENQRRDDDLRSSRFLAIDSFPEMTFVSRRVERAGPTRFRIHGELSLHGVTRPVTLDAEMGGVLVTSRGRYAAFSASTVINRADYGMTFSPILEGLRTVGDEVRISIEIEAREARPAASP
jgi:polyisoprenoid-binding protein YceI